MQRDPLAGYELPLRILVWQDGDAVKVAYHDPRELATGFDLASVEGTLERMAALLEQLSTEATKDSQAGLMPTPR